MSVDVDKTTIKTFQGDSCKITFTDLEEGKIIYFSVRNKKTNQNVFPELRGIVDENGEVNFVITPEMSDNFDVKPLEGVNIYYYGL